MKFFRSKKCIFFVFIFVGFFKTITIHAGNINFRGINSSLIISSGAFFDLQNQLSCTGGTIEFQNPVASTFIGNVNGITFNKGYLKTSKNLMYLNGNLNPTGTDTLTLNNGDFLETNSSESIAETITVSSGATATISGSPIFLNSIALGNASSILQFNLLNPLNQSVTGAGKISLLADLIVGKNLQLPSLFSQNNYSLTMTGGTISTAVTHTTGGTIELAGNTTMSALWTIGTGADVYVFNGNGCVLDLTGTGGITFNGTSLYLNDIHIKGVQTANAIKGSGNIYLSKVTMTLAGDFLRDDGSFYIHGDPCRIITSGNTFTMDGSGHNLNVDKQALFFEQLNGTDTKPFLYTNSALEVLTNGGLIISAITSGSTSTAINSTSYNQTQDLFLTTIAYLQISNATPLTPKAVAYNGSNLFIHFPNTSGSFFALDNNVNLSLTNSVLKDFHHTGISLGTSATIAYGDGVRMELGQDITIATGDTAWTFNGDAEIDGDGSTLTIQKSQGITITGAKTLTFKNMRLILQSSDGIKCLTDSAHIKLQNVELILRNVDFAFSVGNLDIFDTVTVSGGTTAIVGNVNFDFSTKGYLTLGTTGGSGIPAELKINNGINFKYNANPANDSTLAATKQHFVFGQKSARLVLDGCSVESTTTGLTLDNGILEVRNKVYFKSDTTAVRALDFGLQLIVNVMSGATIDLDGKLNLSEAPPPQPLRYGDGCALKHKNYEFYASTSGGNSYNKGFGTNTLNNNSRLVIIGFYINLTNSQQRPWENGSGGSILLQPVKSGDIIAFADYNGNYTGWNQNYPNAPVSTPNPPYSGAASNTDGAGRIFKKGGSIGDNIFSGDDVYFIHLFWTQPNFLGSSNLTFGANKEIFYYLQASGFPPNFTTNFIWTINQYQAAAYAGITNYANNTMYANDGFSALWQQYFVPGGSNYIDPATLQV